MTSRLIQQPARAVGAEQPISDAAEPNPLNYLTFAFDVSYFSALQSDPARSTPDSSGDCAVEWPRRKDAPLAESASLLRGLEFAGSSSTSQACQVAPRWAIKSPCNGKRATRTPQYFLQSCAGYARRPPETTPATLHCPLGRRARCISY